MIRNEDAWKDAIRQVERNLTRNLDRAVEDMAKTPQHYSPSSLHTQLRNGMFDATNKLTTTYIKLGGGAADEIIAVVDGVLRPAAQRYAAEYLHELPDWLPAETTVAQEVDALIGEFCDQARVSLACDGPDAVTRDNKPRAEAASAKVSSSGADASTPAQEAPGTRIFIGHGRSPAWRILKEFVQDRLELPWDEFNREPTAGTSTKERLEEMLDDAAFAFLIMTAEDERTDGTRGARANVIHEVGLFQGRLGFKRAIVLLEEGCEEFSNIVGLSQIRFPAGHIEAAFEGVREVLRRKGLLASNS